jgi:hypothetical protein
VRARAVVAFIALVAAVVAVNAAVARAHLRFDLTAEQSSTLSKESLRVLRSVRSPVDITAFFGRSDAGRVEAATLLHRYRQANRRISFKILDPAQAPGEVRRLHIEQGGSLAVTGSGRTEIAQEAIEIDITSAIARLVRGRSGTVCFTTGHGERDPGGVGPEGYSLAAKLLRDNGYGVRTIDLLADPGVPAECEAIAVAAPTSSPSGEMVAAVRDWLAAAGKALLLADPEAEPDLTPLGDRWGIGFQRGVVLESDPGSRLASDPLSPIIRRYFPAVSAVRGLAPTFMPGVEEVTTRELGDRPGLSTAPLAESSGSSYLERSPGDGEFTEGTDVAGPVVVGASADDSQVEQSARGARIKRTRILALGDADFASNAFVGDAGNARLLVQALDWLTQPEPLVNAVPNFPRVRELGLTQARSRYMLALTAGVVPALFLLSGALMWALRRGL